jgi:putative heme degradation protein
MSKVKIPEDVLIQNLGDESVLLSLESEQYFGLDSVGTAMWNALTTSDSVEAAYEKLLETYEVEPQQLRSDLERLLQQLVEHGLLHADT